MSTRTTSSSTASHAARVTVRFYCQGIGDCHLLRFPKGGGGDLWMLIDCGIHKSVTGGPKTIDAIVDDIASVTNRLDVIVLTHEHWDHVSGFRSAQQKFMNKFTIGEIWMAWTENPDDPQATEFDKFKGAAINALHRANEELKKRKGLSAHLSSIQFGLNELLGFTFGAKGERVREARDALVGLLNKKTKPRYLEPTTVPLQIDGLSNLRIYVLGPPRKTEMFGITKRASEMYGMGHGVGSTLVRALSDPFAVSEKKIPPWDDFTAPFDYNEGFCLSALLDHCVKGNPAKTPRGNLTREQKENRQAAAFLYKLYAGPTSGSRAREQASPRSAPVRSQSWRRIDGDWLGVSADLGIQLDNRTNNSSLVLAFEFIDTGRVMLFVGDAQVGNWLSWKDVQWKDVHWKDKNAILTAHDLLARTVFYKVGHHGSDNATLKANGLELMIHPDLSAFVPTNAKDAENVGWGKKIPFDKLLTALDKRTSRRVIRADDPWIKSATGRPAFPVSGAIKGLRHDKNRGLWVELDIG